MLYGHSSPASGARTTPETPSNRQCSMSRDELRSAGVVLVVMLAMASVQTTYAKRGCSAFGHSCYGGHGKRMDPGAVQASAPEEAVYPGLRDVVFTAPRSDALLDPVQRQRDFLPDYQPQRQEFSLQPLLRQWLQAYRSSQEVRPNNM